MPSSEQPVTWAGGRVADNNHSTESQTVFCKGRNSCRLTPAAASLPPAPPPTEATTRNSTVQVDEKPEEVDWKPNKLMGFL